MNMFRLERFATATPTTEGKTEGRDSVKTIITSAAKITWSFTYHVLPSVSKWVDPSAGTHFPSFSESKRNTVEEQYLCSDHLRVSFYSIFYYYGQSRRLHFVTMTMLVHCLIIYPNYNKRE